MIDITKQRSPEGVSQKRKPTEAAPAPSTTTITKYVTAQPAATPEAPATGPLGDEAMQRIEAIHGEGGARDPFAADVEPVAPPSRLARLNEEVAPSPELRPAEAAPIEESPEASQAAIDQTQNVQRVALTPAQQEQMTEIAVTEAAAIQADRRANLLSDAGLDEQHLATLVKLNPNKTEEEILAISLANNEKWKKSYGHDVMTNVGEQFAKAKQQIVEAATGRGEHVIGGGEGELGGVERAAKVVQAIGVTGLNTLFTPIGYATGELAQNEIMVSPLAPRLQANMQAAGLDITSGDSPNARLEIVNQTLIDAYLHGSAEEANYAAAILVSKGYLEVIAGGGAQGLQQVTKLTGTGLALVRNAARSASRVAAGRAAAQALAASGGLERRIGPQGGVSSRLAAIAASAPSDAEVTRLSTLASRVAAREAMAQANIIARTEPGIVTEVPRGGPNRLIPEITARGGGAEAKAAFKISTETLPEGTRTAAGTGMGGFFNAETGEIRIDPSKFSGSAAPRREVAAAFVHELTHAAQWLATGRNAEKFKNMHDVERLPTQIQAVVLRLLGVSEEQLADPNVAAMLRQRGFLGQLADGIKNFARNEESAAPGVEGPKVYTSLQRYADKSQEARLLSKLNELRYKRTHGVLIGDKPVSQEEIELANKIISLKNVESEYADAAANAVGATRQSLMQAIENRKKTVGLNEVGAPAPEPRTPGQHADIVHKLTTDEGGATYNLKRGDLSGEDAYAVGAYPEKTVKIEGDATPGDIERFIANNEAVLKRGDISIGTYKDPDTGQTILDLVKTPSTEQFGKLTSGPNALKNARLQARKQAIQIAKEAGQDSIYNLRTGEVIKTPKAAPNALDVAGIVQRARAHGTPELFTKAAKWYTNAREFARAMSDEADVAPTSVPKRNVAAAMAALSAQNEWAGVGKMDNLKSIYKLIRAFERGDAEPFAIEEGMNLSGAQVQKAWRALGSKTDPLDELIGAKERSFALNILGEKDMATVDRHIVKGQFTTRNKAEGGALTANEHAVIQAGYEKALSEMKAAGQVPQDMNVRDLQAFDWGILGQKELDFWSAQTERGTMFPGTAPEVLPYKVSEGVGPEPPPDFVVGAERPPMGGMASRAFSRYKSVGDLVRVLKGHGYNGIADFSKAVMEGDDSLRDVPDQLIADFAYGHVERGAIGLWEKPEDIERIVTNYVKFLKSDKKVSINDVLTEEATGKPRDICSTCPTAASPSSPLSIKDGQGDPQYKVPDDSPYGFGGISGAGTEGHGIVGAPAPILPGEQGPLAGGKLLTDIEGTGRKQLLSAIKSANDFERSLTASGDDSFIMNQGWFSMFTHPQEFGHMFVDSFRAMSGRTGLAKVNQATNALPSHDLAVRVGLPLDRGPVFDAQGKLLSPGDSEFFQSAAAENLPVVGKLIQAGSRAYAGAGNSLRSRIFDTYANGWDLIKVNDLEFGSAEYLQKMKLASDLKDYVSMITGIGDISGLPKVLQDIGPAFFAYKFFASKFNMLTSPFTYTMQAMRGSLPSRISTGGDLISFLKEEGLARELRSMPNPLYLSPEHASSWRMAGLAWRDLSLYALGIGVSAASLKALGVDVGLDPNQESKFLQITMGEGEQAFQFDLTGGLGKVVSLLLQTWITREHVTRSGHRYSLDKESFGPYEDSADNLWVTFLEGKLGPAYAQALQTVRGKNYQGKPLTVWDLAPLPITAKNAVEMFFSDAWKNPALWGALGAQFLGAHGFIRDTKSTPPGPLGAQIPSVRDVTDTVFQKKGSTKPTLVPR